METNKVREKFNTPTRQGREVVRGHLAKQDTERTLVDEDIDGGRTTTQASLTMTASDHKRAMRSSQHYN